MLNGLQKSARFLVVGLLLTSILVAKPKEPKPEEVKKEWAPTWSSEVTFTSPPQWNSSADNSNTNANLKALSDYYEKAITTFGKRKDVKSIEYIEAGDKFQLDYVKVRYKNGWGFDVTLDPGVLEVVLKPNTLEGMKQRRNVIQADIFGTMKKIGLEPRIKGEDSGGGHVHGGAKSIFENDAVTFFRNYMVDFQNNPEIGAGAMNRDIENANQLLSMKKSQREAFVEWVRESDAGQFKTVRESVSNLVKNVFLEGKPATGKRIMKAKYWAVNLLRMAYLDTAEHLFDKDGYTKTHDDYVAFMAFDDLEAKAWTIEHRYLKAPRNVDELIKNVVLIEARAGYIRSFSERLPLHPNFIEGIQPTMKEKVALMYKYIEKALAHAQKEAPAEKKLTPLDYLYLLPERQIEDRHWRDWQREYLKNAEKDGLTVVIRGERKDCKTLLRELKKPIPMNGR